MLQSAPKIALIDDERPITNGLRRGFSQLRPAWQIQTFNDPQTFVSSYAEKQFDVIVSDMRMPSLSGLELIEHVQSVYAVPCILLTGPPDLTSTLYAINKAQVFRYYTKPCDLSLLTQGIEAGLATRRPAADTPMIAEETLPSSLINQLGLAALDRLALGVAVIDHGGHVIFANQSAAAIFAAGDGLSLSHAGQCRAGTADATVALMKLVEHVTTGSPDELEDTEALPIARPSLHRPYSVFLSPLHVGKGDHADKPLAAVFISDPGTIPLPAVDHIMKLYGLSRSQALIVQCLAAGLRVEEAADKAGITVSTARTYLKQIFSKTDTSRQSELLKLVLTAPRVIAA